MTAAPFPEAMDTTATSREFGFTQRDFRRIAQMLHADAGIHLNESKTALVYARLVRRLRELGVESFAHYCTLVESESGAGERQLMLAALTTNITSFFREPQQFRHLSAKLLPDLVEQARAGGKIRIWSAGCSTGEEPYSIALSILEAMPDAAQYDVRVLATDINAKVLSRGEAGEYDERTLSPLSRAQRDRWFAASRAADGRHFWRVGDDLRALVSFRQLNLLETWPMRATYQAIFCRNVLIYFDEAGQAAVQRRMTSLLAPSGRFYLGATERIREMPSLQVDGPAVYRREGCDA